MSDSQNTEETDELKQGDSNECRANKRPRSECLDVVPPITQQRDHCTAGPGNVPCSVCPKSAYKSCLTCSASFCGIHVRQHYTTPALQGHKLVEATGDLEQRLCQQHYRALELFCKTNQTPICVLCVAKQHRGHDITELEEKQSRQMKESEMAPNKNVLVPKELTVNEVTTSSAHLSWTLPYEMDLTSHSFLISYSSEGKDEEFISTSSCSTVITGLQPDTHYTVNVSVGCHSGICQPASIPIHTSLVHGKPNGSDMAINNSSQSTQLSRGTKGDLPTPGQIKIKSVAHDAVSLSWEPPEGLTESLRFRVTWKCESTGKLLCSEVPVPNICIQGLTPEVKYEFTVATINDSRGQSTKVVSTAQTTEIPVPKKLTVYEVTPTSALLFWALPYNMDLTRHKFLISYSSAGKGQTCISTPWNNIVITGLQPDTDYTVRVSVVCHSGTFQPASTTFHTNSWENLTLADGDERPSKDKEPSTTSTSEDPDPPHIRRRDNTDLGPPNRTTYYTLAPGKSAECSRDIETWLKPLTKAKSAQSCDMILALCLVVSRVGTDVETALKDIPDDKPTILVVLHHTLDPDCVVPDSSRFTKKEDMLIVDCLFNEDDGLLRCERNGISQSTMLKWIDTKVSCSKVSLRGKTFQEVRQQDGQAKFAELPPPGPIKITSVAHDAVSLSWEPPQGLTKSMRFRVTWKSQRTGDLLSSEVSVANLPIQGLTPGVKYEFTVVTINDSGGQSKSVSTTHATGLVNGKHSGSDRATNNSSHLGSGARREAQISTNLLPESWTTYYPLAPGKSAEYSKDIETWLKPLTKAKSAQSCDIILALCLVVSRVGTDVEAALKAIPDDKPTILVVLHHTFEPDHVVPDSSRFTKRDDMLIVDCLFNEDDGLLRCERNGTAQSTILKWISAKVSTTRTQRFLPSIFQRS
ncbi:uncharacterized protein LOC105904535 isoform X2 [Clupea harengus]|uniref:Uncharacterized protein LOC105904535 isoform X2 n=1 Tax=Clupea harengus TaxID=7950 RepID=A0A8M1KUH0_CLUHA|nr:uncharacterized protein LOC105904535 isoform X2 [Clupea harengus]